MDSLIRNSRRSAAVWLVASAALAQPAPTRPSDASSAQKAESTTVGEVVVRAPAPSIPQSFAKSVEKFVHDVGRPGPVGQISRWSEPVCSMTGGLTPAFDGFVNRRIEEIAARVGAPSRDTCRRGPNVMVVFTPKPDELMADVRKHHEGLLGFHYIVETRSLAAFEPPMKSWYVTMTRVADSDFVAIDQAYASHEPPQGGSHIPPPLKSEFAFVLVVVDANLLEGQAIGPVADRIAMLVLSKPALREGCSPLPSILDFLDPKCPPGRSADGLTIYDEAYLKALYAYKGSEIRFFERESIARRMIAGTNPPVGPGQDAGVQVIQSQPGPR